MLGTLPPQGIETHAGGIGPPTKRFRREGSLADTDRGSSASSSPDTAYNRKYLKSGVKPGNIYDITCIIDTLFILFVSNLMS